MNEKLFVRQLPNGLWQWRLAVDGHWQADQYSTGDIDALADAVRHLSIPAVSLILPGQVAVSSLQPAEINNKKQLQKLVPYEMEDELVDSVEDLHFLLGNIENENVSVVYVRTETLSNALLELEAINCDVVQCLPDYLMLSREQNGATLVWDGDTVLASLGNGLGFTIEAALASLIVGEIKNRYDFTAVINVIGETEEDAQELAACLPKAWREEEGPEIVTQAGSFWTWVNPAIDPAGLNFRSGEFARQLPFAKWWQNWKMPAYVAGVAYALALVVSVGQYALAKSDYRNMIDEMNAVYLDAVPGGRPGDPLRKMESLTQGLDSGGSGSTNSMVLLEGFIGLMPTAKEVKVTSFRYSGDQKEVRFQLEAKNFSDLENLRVAVSEKGFVAELLRVQTQGDMTQATMSVKEGGA